VHRLARLVAIAAAATFLTLSATAGAGIVTPHHIDEMFRGTSIDYTNTWASWGTNQPSYASFAQTDGALSVNVSGAAQPDFNVSGATRCLAHGDFDARVSFSLDTWPEHNGVFVSLMITGTPFNVFRASFADAERYGAYLPPNNAPPPLATGVTGELRLTREGTMISAYYLADHRWVPLLTSAGPTDDVSFTLAVFNISGAATFAGQPVAVSFDNFRVAADAIVCP
jgi:hypothetical protein